MKKILLIIALFCMTKLTSTMESDIILSDTHKISNTEIYQIKLPPELWQKLIQISLEHIIQLREFYFIPSMLICFKLLNKTSHILLRDILTSTFTHQMAQKINQYSDMPISEYTLDEYLLSSEKQAEFANKLAQELRPKHHAQLTDIQLNNIGTLQSSSMQTYADKAQILGQYILKYISKLTPSN